jgi:hypothetical protein
MPLSIPYSLRSKAIVPLISPEDFPSRSTVSTSVSGLVTPRIVKLPCTSKVLGPVCTIIVDLNVINGSLFTSKKSLLLSLSSLKLLPVFRVAAWILTSHTPVETSGEVNVRVASYLSKLPSIATDAFTKNLTELVSGVITKTGACAGFGVAAVKLSIARNTSATVTLTKSFMNDFLFDSPTLPKHNAIERFTEQCGEAVPRVEMLRSGSSAYNCHY